MEAAGPAPFRAALRPSRAQLRRRRAPRAGLAPSRLGGVVAAQRAPAGHRVRLIDRFAEAGACRARSWAAASRTAAPLPGARWWLSTRLAWLAQVGLPKGLAARVHSLEDDALAPLCRSLARANPAALGQLMARLPHPRRATLFERATTELETARIEWPTPLLAVLPTSLRDREAARMLELVRARTDGTWRRELFGLRSIDVARAELEREGQSSQASERGEAHAALVLASMRSRAGMPETLAWLRRIRNEQDPVRMAVLAALARVPGHCFTDPDALDAVGIQPIFEARDTSYATRQHAAGIAHALLVSRATEPGSPMFALGLSVLERLTGRRGTPNLPRLNRNLPRGAQQAIVATLRPWLEAARSRQQDQHLFRLWTALGKRAWRVDELAVLVADTIWHGHKNNGHAAGLWVQDPATRDARVRELVKRDRSALYLYPIFQHCHRRRQTLLDERLADKAPRGRFHDGKIVIIPHVVGGMQRWPTALQRKYVNLVELAEAEPKHFGQTPGGAGGHAGARANHPRGQSRRGNRGDRRQRRGGCARGPGVDRRARAGIANPARASRGRPRTRGHVRAAAAHLVPRDRFVDALAELLARPQLKVTVHKEALRLLGELATPRAIGLLQQTWQQPLHRDVRIAALHAARDPRSARGVDAARQRRARRVTGRRAGGGGGLARQRRAGPPRALSPDDGGRCCGPPEPTRPYGVARRVGPRVVAHGIRRRP